MARYEYDPFGYPTKIAASLDFHFLYTGHIFHPNSGLYLAPYRAYNPKMSRWISREPFGIEGPNDYRYALNSPMLNTDKSGLLTFRFYDKDTKELLTTLGPGKQCELSRLQSYVTGNTKLRQYYMAFGNSAVDV